EDHALLRGAHGARRAAACGQRQEGRARRRDRALPALGTAGSVVAPLPRSSDRIRLGLDAGARTGAPARCRAAAGHLGSRRLGRPHRDHRGDRRTRRVGHARPGGCAGALVRRARASGAAVRHRGLRRRGRTRRHASRRGSGRMNRFAELLDRLAYEPGRNNKLRLMTEYFRSTDDPERGWALAALTGGLAFRQAQPGMIPPPLAEGTGPVLFGLSWDYVGDLSETVALMWPAPVPPPQGEGARETGGWGHETTSGESPPGSLRSPPSPFRGGMKPPTLSAVIKGLATLGKSELPGQLARWLDALDETERWALLKLVTGALRIGVPARLAKTAGAALGHNEPP